MPSQHAVSAFTHNFGASFTAADLAEARIMLLTYVTLLSALDLYTSTQKYLSVHAAKCDCRTPFASDVLVNIHSESRPIMHYEPDVGEPQRRTARAQVELMLSTDGYSGELLDRSKRAENADMPTQIIEWRCGVRSCDSSALVQHSQCDDNDDMRTTQGCERSLGEGKGGNGETSRNYDHLRAHAGCYLPILPWRRECHVDYVVKCILIAWWLHASHARTEMGSNKFRRIKHEKRNEKSRKR